MSGATRKSTLLLAATLLACSQAAEPAWAQEGETDSNFSAPINGFLKSAETTPPKDTTASTNTAITPESTEDAGWSIPILGQLQNRDNAVRVLTNKIASPVKTVPERLEASISAGDQASEAGQALDRLLDAALERDPQTKVIERAVSHYRTKTQIVVAEAKDATDYLIPYRGFGPSSEAGDVILGEKLKLKSRASAEYARQKQIDELHLKVVSNMMQLAMGLGMTDKQRGSEIAESGYSALKELVGEEEANHTKQMLLAWAENSNLPQTAFQQSVWDVKERQEKHKIIVETSLDEDPVIREIKRRIHKYNHHSKLGMASSHVIQTTLGAASLTPTFIGPAAKLALLTYIMSTGGPEQVKIMKELYLDKRFESRTKVVNEEAHLVLENLQLAVLTHNPVLLSCAQSVLGQMVPEDTVKQVCGEALIAARREPGA